MSPAQVEAVYRRGCTQQVRIRRYTGSGGGRTSTDYPASPAYARAKISGDNAGVLVGNVLQYSYDAVVLVDDLTGLTLPITSADTLVWSGKEYSIEFPDNATRSVNGELIAYQIKAKG